MKLQGFAVQSWMMYLGSGVDLMAQYSFSAMRSIATKVRTVHYSIFSKLKYF